MSDVARPRRKLMTPPEDMSLGPSADRALAALETPGGKNRMQLYLASAVAADGGAPVVLDDLFAALRELRRRQ